MGRSHLVKQSYTMGGGSFYLELESRAEGWACRSEHAQDVAPRLVHYLTDTRCFDKSNGKHLKATNPFPIG